METNSTFNSVFGTAVFGTAAAVVLSVEMILALIANGIVLLITITQRKSWKQSSTIFFTSLIILAHLVMVLLCMPLYIIALAAGEWILQMRRREEHVTFLFTSTGTLY